MNVQQMLNDFQVENGARPTAKQLKEIEKLFSNLKITEIIEMVKLDPHFLRYKDRTIRIFNQPNKVNKRVNVVLEQPTTDTLALGYVMRMVKFMLTFSEEKTDYNKAKLEWDLISLRTGDSIKCNMCKEADITYKYEIKNRINGRSFLIGCDCIQNYMSVSMHDRSKLLLKTYRKINAEELKVRVVDYIDCEIKNRNQNKKHKPYRWVKTHCNSTLKRSDGTREPEGLTISKGQLETFCDKKLTTIPAYGVMIFMYDGKRGVCSINERGAFINYKEVQRLEMPLINMGYKKRTGVDTRVKISIVEIIETQKIETTKIKNKILEEILQSLTA